MKPAGCEADLLRAMASMPFLDRLEMVGVCGWSRGAVYEAIESLESGGFCASVPHAVDPLPPARRFHLTAAGLRRLAGEEGVASALSNVAYPIRFRWYRAMPMDAAMTLPDGRTVGIIRQGLTADRSGFSKRLWRLRDWPLPGTLLILMADDVRLRHARRLLSTTDVPALFALEREAVLAGAGDRIWSPVKVSAAIDLRYELDRAIPGSELPWEPEPERADLPAAPPVGKVGGGHVRPYAARHPQVRREARPRPGLGLALGRSPGAGRADGRLAPEGLPARQPPRRLRPREPPSKTPRPPWSGATSPAGERGSC